ncbi:MAG: IS21 family transposase [Ignavibacteriaceae bacterium]|jgi:transposase|nr:IS21 family transposase [Ignavibacteriaceae bacterium]
MPISQEIYSKIRRLHSKENLSIRKIAKMLSIDRKTVRKYCKGEVFPDERINYPEVTSDLKNLLSPAILNLLEENKEVHGKQKYRAKNVYKDLRKLGFTMGESTIRKYIREIRNKKPEGFIPLTHNPGEFIEIDWGDMYVYMNKVKVMVSVFCAVLPFSYKIYAVPLPTKAYDSFFWGHVKSFDFFGGISEKLLFDNLKTAVFKGSGRNAIPQEKFKFFESHYCFESVFCNIERGNEKGSVENLVDIIRKIAFTPIPRVENFEELTVHVHNKCEIYCNEHKLRERKLSIKDAFEIEKKTLTPLPIKAFDCSVSLQVLVYKDLTFRFEGNKYSIFPEYIGQEITIRANPFKIDVYDKGKVIFTHTRTYKSNDPQYIPEHYLKIIERKPRSVHQAAPLNIGIMPIELSEFRRLHKGKDRNVELISVLQLGDQVERHKLLWAVDMANKCGSPTYSLVLFYLEIDNSEVIQVESSINIEKADFKAYDSLLAPLPEGIHNNQTVTNIYNSEEE